jgi:hypothetical protein
MIDLEDRPKCPDARISWYNSTWICTLNDKLCLLEGNNKCPYYEEYLEELREEHNA